MPDIKNIEAALALSKDESKVLGLTLGTQKVAPGQYIPKGGKYFHAAPLSIKGS
jgi:phosphatidylethanolamine-binding protein